MWLENSVGRIRRPKADHPIAPPFLLRCSVKPSRIHADGVSVDFLLGHRVLPRRVRRCERFKRRESVDPAHGVTGIVVIPGVIDRSAPLLRRLDQLERYSSPELRFDLSEVAIGCLDLDRSRAVVVARDLEDLTNVPAQIPLADSCVVHSTVHLRLLFSNKSGSRGEMVAQRAAACLLWKARRRWRTTTVHRVIHRV